MPELILSKDFFDLTIGLIEPHFVTVNVMLSAVDANRDTSKAITKVTPATSVAANTFKPTTMASTDDQNKFTINLRIRGIPSFK